MNIKNILSLLLFILPTLHGAAQSLAALSGEVVAKGQNKAPLPYALIRLENGKGRNNGTVADENGHFRISSLQPGPYKVTVSYMGYETLVQTLTLKGDVTTTFYLTPSLKLLQEVVVTASESKGITSASKIDRTAMEHLQPTSFTDLLALLPGGKTQNPRMGSANIIRLREVGISSSDYNTSSLGTQFVVDGTPINTDANMQYVSSDLSDFSAHNAVNAGVDMRDISTDNIQSVEIVRGIPSVKYGDLTSGVVIINRKQQATPLEARFKADQYGKLFSAGKGFGWSKHEAVLSADLGFLDSKSDPRNRLKNFERINASIRLDKTWRMPGKSLLKWYSALDYNGNIDNEKTDPDIQTQPEDNFSSSHHAGGWSNKLRLQAPTGSEKVFRSLELNLSAKMSWDKIKRSRFIGLDRTYVAPTYYEPGEHDAEILPSKYVAHAVVDGRPASLYANLQADFRFHTGGMQHHVLGGANWTYAKNLGNGQVYDLARPLDPMYNSTRPRRYIDIPASEQLAFYAEDQMKLPIGLHRLDIQAGVRSLTALNLKERYAMRGKFYLDPRLNLQWRFPGIKVGSQDLNIDLSGGLGWLTKMPTLDLLYPETVYLDIIQLNYWNANPNYRRVNLRTYVIDPTNYRLAPARNRKWELRLGLEYHRNNLSVTYFREKMRSGFRSTATYAPYQYKKYDASGVDGSTLTAPPSLQDLPYTTETVLRGYGQTENGSETLKEGWEFQFASERFPVINTRLTINGAWFRTVYSNSVPTFQPKSLALGDVALSDKYIGLYENEDSYLRETFNTNFIIDTWLSKPGLKLSATVECTWYESRQSQPISGVPIAYMDISGEVKPYTEADRTDAFKQYLITTYNEAAFNKYRTPFYMYVNFKATKDFGKNVSIALFADRLLDFVPDYHQNGLLVRRTPDSAYFGMELNFKL